MTSGNSVRDMVNELGVSQRTAAKMIGIGERTMRKYVSPTKPEKAPQPVEMALELLILKRDLADD